MLTNFSDFQHQKSNITLSQGRLYPFLQQRNVVENNLVASEHYGFDFPDEVEAIERNLQRAFFRKGSTSLIRNTAEFSKEGFIGGGIHFSSVEQRFYLLPPAAFLQNTPEYTGSFSLELMVFPTAMLGEMNLFELSNFVYPDKTTIYSEGIFVRVEEGRVVVQFENFFHFKDSMRNADLGSRDVLRLNEWNHLKINFNSENGLLQLLIDGKVVDFSYVTFDGTHNTNIFLPGMRSNLAMYGELGRGLIGYIDELNVSGNASSNLEMMRKISPLVRNEQNYVAMYESKVFRLQPFSRLEKINLIDGDLILNNTILEICYSQKYFMEIALAKDKKCQRVEANQPFIQAEEGLYYQLKFIYKSNDRKKLYGISGFQLDYNIDSPPFPPELIRVESLEDGTFLVVWKRSGEDDIMGYSIYFSSAPFVEIDGRQHQLDISLAQLLRSNETEQLNLFYHYVFIDPADFIAKDETRQSNIDKNSLTDSLEGLYHFGLRSYDKIDQETGIKRKSMLSNVVSSYLRKTP